MSTDQTNEDEKGEVRVTLRLPTDVHEQLKTWAKVQRRTVQAALEVLIEDTLRARNNILRPVASISGNSSADTSDAFGRVGP